LISELDPDDLRYVLNVLARPTELWFIDRSADLPKLVSDKASQLVEKTYFSDDYRLASAGRAAVAVAANIESFAYAEGDVLKLLRAIEAGDFSRVGQFCDAILDSVRYESMDLQLILEKGYIDKHALLFKEQIPRYRQVIKHSTDLLRQADAKLKALCFADGDELDNELGVDLFDLEQQLLKVWRAIEAFGRQLSELTSLAAERRASTVKPPDFLAMALQMVKAPLSEEKEIYLFRQFGPIRLDTSYPSPMDVHEKVVVGLKKTSEPGSFDTDGSEAVFANPQLVFLEEHGRELTERLLQGPLDLAEALHRGWCRIGNDAAIEELIGVYIAPWILDGSYTIEIHIPDRITSFDSPEGDLLVNNLQLVLIESEAT
jgi:hypothetical protein